MSRKLGSGKEIKEYKPKIVRAKLHTGGKSVADYRKKLHGQGFTVRDFRHMQKADNYLDGIEVYLSLWDYDNHENWHLWNWEKEADERIMCAMFEAEHYSPFGTSSDDFGKFRKAWKAGEYEPGGSYCFENEQVEVLEVLQEEENPHCSEETRRMVRRAKEEKWARSRKNQQKKYRGK